jgi:hypothetical protein
MKKSHMNAILVVMVMSACFALNAWSVSLSGEWQFQKGGGQEWTTVEVPHELTVCRPHTGLRIILR